VIKARNLTKTYGSKVAVDDLSFTVQPGIVTGFLGPNGAGKSTTMRLILGLDAPTSGTVTVNGRPYAEHPRPLQVVGALLEARAVHTSRSAYQHLRALAATHGIPCSRVDEVVGMVGLQDVARKRASASPPHCSPTPRSSFWTSRSTGWTPTECGGSATCSPRTLPAAAPSSSPAT